MEVWQKVTEEDDNGFERVRKEQQPSDREDAGECDDDDVNGQLNVSKRVSTATPPSKKLKLDCEKNSLDAAIQQKKIG